MSRRPSPSSRRLIPIKRADGEPLSRNDLQYDFLYNVFTDPTPVFTDPWPGPEDPPKLTFCSLYIKSLLNSAKATKAFRDKLSESNMFAQDFSMIALLVNVGRINTTMSFFPEMKTTIRSYHPVPALQRTSGNLQDAPRIKHMLKAVALEDELKGPPTVPANILSRLSSGHLPPTTVTNLIFVLANHSGPVGRAHLPDNISFLDLFLRTDISSASRAKAFLWICFNYLECATSTREDDYDDDVTINPFGDPGRKGGPSLVHLTADEMASENVDPDHEQKLAEKLIEHRGNLLHGKDKVTLAASGSAVGDGDDQPALGGEDVSVVSKGKRKRENAPSAAKNARSVAAKDKTSATDDMPKARKHKVKAGDSPATVPRPLEGGSQSPSQTSSTRATRHRIVSMQNQYPPPQSQASSANHQAAINLDMGSGRRYAPYQKEYATLKQSSDIYHAARSRRPVPPRTFLQHAWLKVTTVDPLVDSDDELGDEHARHEYMERLRVVAGILGPPFLDSIQPVPSEVDPHYLS